MVGSFLVLAAALATGALATALVTEVPALAEAAALEEAPSAEEPAEALACPLPAEAAAAEPEEAEELAPLPPALTV